MSLKSLRDEYRATLKSKDTEETIDLLFYRPIGFAWAKLCAAVGITPNVITIASIFIGVAAGVMFYFDNLWYNVIGMLLLIWANSFDSADGQLARMTKQYSRLGRILDGVSGDLWFVTIYFAICFRMIQCFNDPLVGDLFVQHHWIIWAIAIVAGICHAKQAAMADYYRQFHLYFLKGKEGSELERVELLDAKLSRMSWRKEFGAKLVLFFYRNYTANQESMTPAMQTFRRELRERYGEELPQELRDDFRRASLPLMKYTNWLSFNMRTITLFIALFCRVPWCYFVAEIVIFNALLIYMWRRHEAICRRFINSIKQQAV